ncbi:Maph122 [Matsumuraeses phaseoli granulovirus]|uniref:Maph122 n=1 Tax=Matsumuraeses phaseoli granulovirus TaxID=2760664 RepID=A0AAE7MLI7_9BBAC|nr:Maph122 [Matsumuraeses phaseoli granulovirus]QOD40085.1 Maph122 [Matsumuraeses phaseoli granulovirus]
MSEPVSHEPIELEQLSKLEFITDSDVALSDQYTFKEIENGLYAYINKTNENIAYFDKKLVNLDYPGDKYYVYT